MDDPGQVLEQAIAKLREYGFRTDVLDVEPYIEAEEQVVQQGARSVASLVEHLGEGEWIAEALGRIGTDVALTALEKELRTDDWRRVCAAVKALGTSRSPKAIGMLERARERVCRVASADGLMAIESALGRLRKATAQTDGVNLQVDVREPLTQARHISANIEKFLGDEAGRFQAERWWTETAGLADTLSISDEDKASLWYCLGAVISSLRLRTSHAYQTNCPEAAHCIEQALRLTSRDKDQWLRAWERVSGRPFWEFKTDGRE